MSVICVAPQASKIWSNREAAHILFADEYTFKRTGGSLDRCHDQDYCMSEALPGALDNVDAEDGVPEERWRQERHPQQRQSLSGPTKAFSLANDYTTTHLILIAPQET